MHDIVKNESGERKDGGLHDKISVKEIRYSEREKWKKEKKKEKVKKSDK